MGLPLGFSHLQTTRMIGVQDVTEFLESSTIHGLSYIAANRGLVRLFWICVVITGFTGAAVLIHQSFFSWAKSPISTTIETRPISELEFPNVTVCPPRNSFTNLNPDIVRSREISLSERQRQTLSEQVSQVVFTSNMESKFATYKECQEEDRFRNQYQGLSKILLQTQSGNGRYTRLNYKGEREISSAEIMKIIFPRNI